MADDARVTDPRKVRQGLVIITVVVVVAMVLTFVIEAPIGKAVMLAVALTGIVRAYLLSRALRTDS